MSAAPILEVRGLRLDGAAAGVSFSLRRGEILGFAGLVGSGRSEVAKAIFGLDRSANGVVELKSRRTGEREELSVESALARLTA